MPVIARYAMQGGNNMPAQSSCHAERRLQCPADAAALSVTNGWQLSVARGLVPCAWSAIDSEGLNSFASLIQGLPGAGGQAPRDGRAAAG